MVDGVTRDAEHQPEALRGFQWGFQAAGGDVRYDLEHASLLEFDRLADPGPGEERLVVQRKPIVALEREGFQRRPGQSPAHAADAVGVVQCDLGDVVAARAWTPV